MQHVRPVIRSLWCPVKADFSLRRQLLEVPLAFRFTGFVLVVYFLTMAKNYKCSHNKNIHFAFSPCGRDKNYLFRIFIFFWWGGGGDLSAIFDTEGVHRQEHRETIPKIKRYFHRDVTRNDRGALGRGLEPSHVVFVATLRNLSTCHHRLRRYFWAFRWRKKTYHTWMPPKSWIKQHRLLCLFPKIQQFSVGH